MANYIGTTASNGGTIKKGKVKELEAYLSNWHVNAEGDFWMDVEGNTLQIGGEGDFWPQPVVTEAQAKANPDLEEGEVDIEADGDPEGFLKGLVPFLKVQGKDKDRNLIVIQSVGHEKCRFPLGAGEYILLPDGKVEFNGFRLSHVA